MKGIFKKIIAFILCFSIASLTFVRPVKADGLIWDTLLDEYKAMKEMSQWTLYDVFDMLHLGSYGLIPEPSQSVKDLFGSYYDTEVAEKNNVEVSNVTDSMRLNYLHNAFTINDNSVVISDSLQNVIKNWQQGVINATALRYYFSGDISGKSSLFFTADQYLTSKNFIEENQINYYINCYSYAREIYIYLYEKSNVGFVLNYSNRKVIIDKSTWQPVYYSSIGNNAKCYKVSENGVLSSLNISYITDEWDANLNNNGNCFFRSGDRVKQIITSGYVEMIPVYTIVSGLQSETVGEYPYYVNAPVYNSFKSSSGDYTITNDNSNKATYGDITTYIDDHHTETGDFPTLPEINVFIENYEPPAPTPTPTPNPDNPSGGGSFVNNNNPSITNNPTFNNNPNINITLFPSVSDNGLNGGTVSGNGGQGSIGNIFDWIGNLGNVIANLIKNVGEMIVKALQGVIEAVTTILSGIPNILTPIIEFVFGGLPDELQALISLGITCIIFVGIIKALKR